MRKLFNQLYLIRLPSITALWWHHRDVIKTTVSFQWYCSFVKYLIQYILTWHTETCLGFFFSLPSVTKINSWRHSVADTEAKKKHVSKTGSATQAWAGTPVSHLSVMVTVTVTAAEMEPGGVLQGLERAAASGYHASPPGELTWDCRSPLWPPPFLR